MKVIVENKERTPLPFPKLMIAASGRIVIMESPSNGIQLTDSDGGFFMRASSAWSMEDFSDFTESITLSN